MEKKKWNSIKAKNSRQAKGYDNLSNTWPWQRLDPALQSLHTNSPSISSLYIKFHEKGTCKYKDSIQRQLHEVQYWTDRTMVQELVGFFHPVDIDYRRRHGKSRVKASLPEVVLSLPASRSVFPLSSCWNTPVLLSCCLSLPIKMRHL